MNIKNFKQSDGHGDKTGKDHKDVVYVDVDDEITSIIDKVRGSGQRIVALVLPKRASVLQSIVNMKLLKRASDEAKKHIVLITAETGLMPLAASVGLYVARSLQSRPEIPEAEMHDHKAHEEEISDDEGYNPEVDKKRPVGELAASQSELLPEEEAIEMNDEPDEEAAGAATGKAKKPKSKKNSKLKIPDFNKFRLGLIIGGTILLVLPILWYVGFVIMPRATVSVTTDSSALNAKVNMALSTDAKALNVAQSVVPAQTQTTQKTTTQQADTTGQLDKGNKATGTMKFVNCSLNDVATATPRTIPAGTGVSANGLTFVTTTSVTVQPSTFKEDLATCKKDRPSDSVNVVAQGGGEKYNVAATNYSVAGFSGMTGVGSDMAGGTSSIVKNVAQTDIDNLKQKLTAADTTGIKAELVQALRAKNLVAVDATFKANAPEYTTSANVGDEATSVSVTQKTTYTMLGVAQADLQKVVAENIANQFDPKKQKILDYGLDGATFASQGSGDSVSMTTTVIVGSDLNVEALKQQIAGQKANTAKEAIGANPGVTKVEVKYSPFWVTRIPKDVKKINLTIVKPSVKTNGNQR